MGKYLGLPELFTRKKRDLFSSIVERIKIRAASWSTRRLSAAGKLTMLKSVLSAVPTYSMSCFPLPVGLCDQIQSALTCFWWDDDPSTRKISWVSWDSLSQHKDIGGLGFRDIQDFNVAMLAKNAWRILTSPDCLLARLLLGKYCHNSSFLSSSCSSSASHGWRGVVAGCNLLKLQTGKAIGNGNTTSVWKDSWFCSTTKTVPFGPPTEATRDLVVSDLLIRWSGEWNRTMVESVLPELAEEIYLVKPSLLKAEDAFCWLKTKTGDYSVKSGYYALREETSIQRTLPPTVTSFDWQKFVWRENTSPKLKLFLWKLCRGALPLRANLQGRGIITTGTCPHCNNPETTYHLFFSCPFALQVWDLVPFQARPNFSHASSLHECFLIMSTCICLPPTGLSSNLFSWVLWGLWTTRNMLIFENRAIPARTTVDKATSSAREWLLAQATSSPNHFSPPQSVVQLPIAPDVIRCNTDAAWTVAKRAGLGWHFDDITRHIRTEASKVTDHVSSPLMAEALALREAVQTAQRNAYTNVWFRTDSQELARAINSKTYSVELFGVLTDIELLSSYFRFFFVSFISRDHNGGADTLAKTALHSSVSVL